MVKNISGGNKSKGFARKDFAKKVNALRLSQDDDEIYAQVKKIYGGAACQVVTLYGTEMLCHIRGKFRGRGRRDNFISNGTWLLVGLREWEKEPAPGKLAQCDVIEVYNDSDKERLKISVTSENWSLFISNDNKSSGSIDLDVDGFTFSDEKTQEFQDLIETQMALTQSDKKNIINSDNGEEVNVDDI